MEKFHGLPMEKKNKIINAALKSFGTNGYKKASISEIATAAGISKAMIFHYFGTKKALYLYLIYLCISIIMNEVNEKFDYSVTDFFDRIRLSTDIEISVMKKHPAIPSFVTSVYFESDEYVKDDIKVILLKSESLINKIALDGIDVSKFKDDIDPKLVFKMLTWLTDGYVKYLSGKSELDIENISNEFYECMDLFKNNFYKE